MTNEYIAGLKKNWLAAETAADELKRQAEQIDTELKQSSDGDVKVLLTRSEQVLAQHQAAEQAASDAFDRLWQARDTGGAAVSAAK